MTKATLTRRDLAEIAELMKEAAAAVHLLPESVSDQHKVRETLVPDLMARVETARRVLDATAGVTVEQAKALLDEAADGTLLRTSPTKGGRAWLEGEWALDELEALCVILRHEAGDHAVGASEHVIVWKDGE